MVCEASSVTSLFAYFLGNAKKYEVYGAKPQASLWFYELDMIVVNQFLLFAYFEGDVCLWLIKKKTVSFPADGSVSRSLLLMNQLITRSVLFRHLCAVAAHCSKEL